MVAVFEETNGGNSFAAFALADLEASIKQAGDVAMGALDRGEMEAFVVGVLQSSDRLRAFAASAVAAADEARIAGRRSLNAHLAGLLGVPSSSIAPSRTLGLWLPHFPEFSAAWAAGQISEPHVRELKKLDNSRTRHLLQRDQYLFVEWAGTLEFSDFEKAIAYWLLAADPDGELSPERAASYGISFRPDRNGDLHVTGTLDPISGIALRKAVEHESQKILKQQTDEGVDVLPVRKRRLIGLMKLVNRGFVRKDGTIPFPLVNIVVGQKIAEAILHDLLNGTDTASALLDPFDIDSRCETITGIPIHPRRVVPALLVGMLRRQIFKPNGKTAEYSASTRLFPPAMKNALLVEARGTCATPGCDAPFHWLQADHVQPASKHGPTSVENGQILCQPDNHAKRDS